MTIAATIIQKLATLPPDKQRQVLDYVQWLAREPGGKPLFDPAGILSGMDINLTFEDFQQARREMWGT